MWPLSAAVRSVSGGETAPGDGMKLPVLPPPRRDPCRPFGSAGMPTTTATPTSCSSPRRAPGLTSRTTFTFTRRPQRRPAWRSSRSFPVEGKPFVPEEPSLWTGSVPCRSEARGRSPWNFPSTDRPVPGLPSPPTWSTAAATSGEFLLPPLRRTRPISATRWSFLRRWPWPRRLWPSISWVLLRSRSTDSRRRTIVPPNWAGRPISRPR